MKINRSIIWKLLTVLVLAGGVFSATTAQSQAPAPVPAAKDTASLVKLIAAQQDELAANQKKIDEKIAAIEEEIRKANIYVSRGGGK